MVGYAYVHISFQPVGPHHCWKSCFVPVLLNSLRKQFGMGYCHSVMLPIQFGMGYRHSVMLPIQFAVGYRRSCYRNKQVWCGLSPFRHVIHTEYDSIPFASVRVLCKSRLETAAFQSVSIWKNFVTKPLMEGAAAGSLHASASFRRSTGQTTVNRSEVSW